MKPNSKNMKLKNNNKTNTVQKRQAHYMAVLIFQMLGKNNNCKHKGQKKLNQKHFQNYSNQNMRKETKVRKK